MKAISKKTTNKPSFYPRLFKKQLSVLASNAYTSRRMAIKLPSSIFQHIRILQQVDFKFILAVSSSPPLLVCIDQHAADERVKLEALENSLLNAPFPSHQVQSIALILNESEKSLVVRNNETLLFWGFEVDISTWTLNRVPIVDHREATDDDLLEYLCLLSSMSGSLVRPPIITRLLHSRACRSAIMFGDPLTLDECQQLITQLGTCRLPFQCAHGRPSIVPLAQFTL
ncbi:DNA mismatch repair protein [Aphanomyces cochlioides]|nr:DNA mismatch repair protein [Aphanomyces cochlioides]